MNLRSLPIGWFGAVMGLVGLGLSARAAAPLFPGVVRAPAYVTEPWIALGVLAFLALSFLYLIKIFRYPGAVQEEFTSPVQIGFCGALPVGMSLVAGGIGPYWVSAANILWWASFALMLAFQAWALVRWLSGGIELAQVNAGWLIVMVGGIVLPGPGIALGHVEASRFAFGVSAAGSALLVPLLLYRAVLGPPLPEVLRPSWFILLVPPSLIYANGLALYPGLNFLENLLYFGVVLGVALVVYARNCLRWKFGVPWWAFTFPLDALAYATARYAQDHSSELWRGIAALTLLVAALAVGGVLIRSVAGMRRA